MQQIDISNPYDGTIVGNIKLTSEPQIELALSKAHELHQKNRQGLQAHLRIKILKKASAIMKSRADDLAHMIAAEGGKPLIDAKVEVDRAVDGVDTCAAEIGHNNGKEIPMNFH